MFVDLSNAGKNTGEMRVWLDQNECFDKTMTQRVKEAKYGKIDGSFDLSIRRPGEMSVKSLKMGLKC
jgi:hypothetical protein